MYNCLTLFYQLFLVLFLMYIRATCQEHPADGGCKHDSLPPSNATVLVELFSLPVSYSAASLPADPTVQLQIRNTLALYPLAIDGKNFDALNRIFTSDVVANYSAPLNVITGLLNLQAVLNASLFFVTTQHSFATQIIDVLEGNCKAKSITYFTATHFGQGDYYGQVSGFESKSYHAATMQRTYCYAFQVSH